MDETIRTAAISPLRQRMIDDMNVRRFSPATQHNYIRDVSRFATFLGRSPDTATPEDVRRFQIEQREAGVPTPTMNSIVSALRFFFTQTIDRPDLARKLVRAAHPRNLPVVLSRDEVARLLNATTCLKHQAALSVAYGAGLRVAEVAALKVTDVDSERMLLRVERGKGGRYRNAMLPADFADFVAGVVEGGAAARRDAPTRLVVSGSERDEADQHPAFAPDRRRGGTGGGDYQAGRATHAAAQLRGASAGRRRRYPRDPGPARSRPPRYHHTLHEGGYAHGARRDQPAR
jgi:integrase/recombinase XerD